LTDGKANHNHQIIKNIKTLLENKGIEDTWCFEGFQVQCHISFCLVRKFSNVQVGTNVNEIQKFLYLSCIFCADDV